MGKPALSPDRLFTEAQRLHVAGRVEDAVRLYRAILDADPMHAPSLHYLGVAAHQAGRTQEAIAQIQQALEIAPDDVGALINLAEALRAGGQWFEAEATLGLAVELAPGLGAAQFNLGQLLLARHRFREAAEVFSRLAEISTHREQAAQGLKQAQAALETGQPPAREIAPGDASRVQYSIGLGLSKRLKHEAARARFERAIELDPTWPQPYIDLGTILHSSGDLDTAIACCRRAIELFPESAQAWCNLGIAMHQAARQDEAMAAFSEAAKTAPDHHLVHWNRSLVLLLVGQWREGWDEFEWRWKLKDRKPITQPRWQGDPLNGRTLLIFPEQGLGDTLQMLRYLPLIKPRFGDEQSRVLFSCPPEFRRLLAGGIDGVEVLFDARELPPLDIVCPVFSLPRIFGTTPDNVPPSTVRLTPAERSEAATLIRAAPGRKIGIVWAGRPTHPNDRQRSMPLASLAPLVEVPDTSFFALQKGPSEAQLDEVAFSGRVTALGPKFSDLADTAAAIEALDLVIAVDTSVAHLAGCLGKETWLMVSHVPDWRWLQSIGHTPWYATMRVFRQPAIGDWAGLVSQMVDALRGWQPGRALAAGTSPRG